MVKKIGIFRDADSINVLYLNLICCQDEYSNEWSRRLLPNADTNFVHRYGVVLARQLIQKLFSLNSFWDFLNSGEMVSVALILSIISNSIPDISGVLKLPATSTDTDNAVCHVMCKSWSRGNKAICALLPEICLL